MQPEFWHERWRTGQIGFHQACSRSQFDAATGRVLDLASGKPRVRALVRQEPRYAVAARPGACRGRRRTLRDGPRVVLHGKRGSREAKGAGQTSTSTKPRDLQLFRGDFFALKSAALGEVAAVYDRAALIAWTQELRAPYVRASGRTPEVRNANAAGNAGISAVTDVGTALFLDGRGSGAACMRPISRFARSIGSDILANETAAAARAALRNYPRSAITGRVTGLSTRNPIKVQRSWPILATPGAIWRLLWSPAPPPTRAARGRTHDRSAVRCAGPIRALHHRIEDLARLLAGDLSSGQAGGQGSPRSLGIQHPRPDARGSWWTRRSWRPPTRSYPMRSLAAASVREPRPFRAFWNIPLRPPAARCYFPWTAGSITTISAKSARQCACCESPAPTGLCDGRVDFAARPLCRLCPRPESRRV